MTASLCLSLQYNASEAMDDSMMHYFPNLLLLQYMLKYKPGLPFPSWLNTRPVFIFAVPYWLELLAA
jgi:hypothetical protein